VSVDKEFEELSTVDMVRHVALNAQKFEEGSPAQVLYIFSHLNTITMSSLDDLMELSANDLMNARNLIDLTLGMDR
jgi:hypothetical protein